MGTGGIALGFAVGSAVAPGIGSVVGAVLGGISGSMVADRFSVPTFDAIEQVFLSEKQNVSERREIIEKNSQERLNRRVTIMLRQLDEKKRR